MNRKNWKPRVDRNDPKNAGIIDLMKKLRKEVRERHGTEMTYEQRRDAADEVVKDMRWLDANEDLQEMVTDDDEVDIAGVRYRRLNNQHSPTVYYGRWGSHEITESLYRQVGVHNGPTVKPLEFRAGMVARRMTPDLARVLGKMSAELSSRGVERMMRVVGITPPSRSFVEKRGQQMAGEIAQNIEELEESARCVEPVLDEVASVSCGMDRMSVRMCEPHSDPDNAPEPRRTEPYQRTPPPPKEHLYRMAWVGTTTAYNDNGEPLHTWRYAAEASAEPASLARRVSADVAHLVRERPDIAVNCIQDAAPELRILPETLRTALPTNSNINELVDFKHLMKYLEDVVDACEPEGDPRNMKSWYRHELLKDDAAIDRIWCNLRRLGRRLDKSATAERQAVAAALSYIRNRKDKMRYASYYAANLAIGSGATEGTCGLMQKRVKCRGQSWIPRGLRGILTLRGLALSDRWDAAWQPYAATHRKEVRRVA